MGPRFRQKIVSYGQERLASPRLLNYFEKEPLAVISTLPWCHFEKHRKDILHLLVVRDREDRSTCLVAPICNLDDAMIHRTTLYDVGATTTQCCDLLQGECKL